MPRIVWALLAAVGAAVPLVLSFLFWLQYGGRFDLLFVQAFGSPGAVFFACDLLLSATAFAAYMITQQKVRPVPHFWAPLAGLFALGFCFALPCWLWLRAGIEEAS